MQSIEDRLQRGCRGVAGVYAAERHANLALLSLVGSINPRGVNTGVAGVAPRAACKLSSAKFRGGHKEIRSLINKTYIITLSAPPGGGLCLMGATPLGWPHRNHPDLAPPGGEEENIGGNKKKPIPRNPN